MWFYTDYVIEGKKEVGWRLFCTEHPRIFALYPTMKGTYSLEMVNYDTAETAEIETGDRAKIMFEYLIYRLQASTPPEAEFTKYPFSDSIRRNI